MNYADLQVTTHFSFLRGASSPEELFSAAALLGIKALGIVDRNSLAGMVRAHEAAKATGVRLIVGCRLDLQCGTSLLVYPTDRAAYGAALPAADARQDARRQRAMSSRLAGCRGMERRACWRSCCPMKLKNDLPGELQPPAPHLRRPRLLRADAAFSARRSAPAAASSPVPPRRRACRLSSPMMCFITVPARRMLQDVVTCIRLHTTIDNAGFQKERHADRFLKAPDEMLRLFPKYEEAVRRTQEIAERCTLLARSTDLHLSDRNAARTG